MTHVDIAATIAPEDKLSKTLLKDIKVNEESIDIIELRMTNGHHLIRHY